MYTIKKVVILNVSIFRICDLVTDVVLLETITTAAKGGLTCFSHGALDLLQ